MKYRKTLRLLLVLSVLALGLTYCLYERITGPLVLAEDAEEQYLEIPKGTTFDSLSSILLQRGFIQNEKNFRNLAEQLDFTPQSVRRGRFAITPGMDLADLIRSLKKGKQAPVMVILTTEREAADVAAKVARYLEPDATSFNKLFTNAAFLDSIGYTPENLMTLFIPNSYELFWTTTPREFVLRMIREHESFWAKQQRYQKANKLKMSSAEVYTLASIVEKETLRDDEKQRMAGVYYNRLQTNMKLQADPTAVFASRDFNTNRVTKYHLRTDSPYNTYIHKGLPPGPIAMASISSIDAVLNHEKHDYLYFCAKGDGSGYHTFAKTLEAHKRNAKTYRENRRKRGK